jgi:ABC-type lipoprotein export system ATPase subunit
MRVSLSNISVAYGTNWAVKNASLTLNSHETCALMGPSGSGKSTLLGVISGLILPTEGDISGPARPNVQWVFQSSPLLDRRSVVDNVAISSIARGDDPDAARERAFEILDEFGLAAHSLRAAYTLSGGQRQRVAIARAIAAHPDILLADEPTASLDGLSRGLICDALDHAAISGALVVVATHDEYVAQRCDKIISIGPAHP